MSILLKGVRVIDPAAGVDAETDVLLANGLVERLGPGPVPGDCEVFEANGLVVCPGLIDVHVHFRQPGQEHKETIATGSRAAAMGGYTQVVCEPNTLPPIDDESGLAGVQATAEKDAVVRVLFKCAMTVRQDGFELVDVEQVKAAGAVALSDDGEPVLRDGVMRRALMGAREHGLLVTPHCEESQRSRTTDPWPQAYRREPDLVARDLALAAETGGRMHISHLSTAEGASLLAGAKAAANSVSGEVTPHHLALSQESAGNNTNAKTNPPLRTQQDVEALNEALGDGVIEVIASDHAPHSPEEKKVKWQDAPFGTIGLETALGVVLTHLVGKGRIPVSHAIAAMSSNPSRIFGLRGGTLAVGSTADVTLIDLGKKWVVDPESFQSKGRNCAFAGWKLKGRAVGTIVGGKWVMREGQLLV